MQNWQEMNETGFESNQKPRLHDMNCRFPRKKGEIPQQKPPQKGLAKKPQLTAVQLNQIKHQHHLSLFETKLPLTQKRKATSSPRRQNKMFLYSVLSILGLSVLVYQASIDIAATLATPGQQRMLRRDKRGKDDSERHQNTSVQSTRSKIIPLAEYTTASAVEGKHKQQLDNLSGSIDISDAQAPYHQEKTISFEQHDDTTAQHKDVEAAIAQAISEQTPERQKHVQQLFEKTHKAYRQGAYQHALQYLTEMTQSSLHVSEKNHVRKIALLIQNHHKI